MWVEAHSRSGNAWLHERDVKQGANGEVEAKDDINEESKLQLDDASAEHALASESEVVADREEDEERVKRGTFGARCRTSHTRMVPSIPVVASQWCIVGCHASAVTSPSCAAFIIHGFATEYASEVLSSCLMAFLLLISKRRTMPLPPPTAISLIDRGL